MVKYLRIDDRLIHGQVAMAWTSYLSANTIVVADDTAATDMFQEMALKLAKPAGVDLFIHTVEDAGKLVKESTENMGNVFVVCASTDAALKVAEISGKIKHVGLGGIRKADGKRFIERQIFLDENDINNMKKMEELGAKVEIQVIPSEKIISCKAAEEIYNKSK